MPRVSNFQHRRFRRMKICRVLTQGSASWPWRSKRRCLDRQSADSKSKKSEIPLLTSWQMHNWEIFRIAFLLSSRHTFALNCVFFCWELTDTQDSTCLAPYPTTMSWIDWGNQVQILKSEATLPFKSIWPFNLLREIKRWRFQHGQLTDTRKAIISGASFAISEKLIVLVGMSGFQSQSLTLICHWTLRSPSQSGIYQVREKWSPWRALLFVCLENTSEHCLSHNKVLWKRASIN